MKKLIRDNIPEIMKRDGVECKYYVADKDEFKEMLIKKLGEECSELQVALTENNMAHVYEEYGDVTDILNMLKNIYAIEGNTLRDSMVRKHTVKGGFTKRLIGEFKDE